MLKAYKITGAGVRGNGDKERVTDKAKRVEKIKVCLRWQPATDIDCNLAIVEVSPDDGAGDINIIPYKPIPLF